MKRRFTLILALALVLVLAALTAAGAGGVMLMGVDTLKSRLDNNDVVVLDVRTGVDWSSSESMIKNARRADPKHFDTWAAGLDPGKTIVFYCA